MSTRSIWLGALAAAVGGCISYQPQQVAALSTYRICDLQLNQGPNLSAESRRLLDSELARRKASCAPHMQALHAARDEDLREWTYGGQSP